MNIKIFTAVLLLTSTSACGSGQASFAKTGEPGGLKEPGSTAPVSAKGVATGLYEQDGEKLSFSHAVVLRQDDAEKMSMTGPGLRVLLSDVETGAEVLAGTAFPPVTTLAQAGKVHGIMLDFDPAKPDSLHVTLLDGRPGNQGRSMSTSLNESAGLWTKLEVKGDRITAQLKDRPGMKFSFSAPIMSDPVKQDLTGVPAQANSITALLKDQANAIGRGDIAAISAVMSKRRKPEVDNAPPGMVSAMKAQAPMMLASVGQITRLVVRENTAVAIGPNGSFNSFVREDGVWKID